MAGFFSDTINVIMLVTEFFSWWYGAGWKLLAKNVQRRLERTLLAFSVPTLARTLFAPWKRIVTAPGAGISEHMRAALDNLVSRLVGFTVRLTVLLAAGVSLAIMAFAGLVQVVAWPLLPLIILFCLVRGVLA